MRDKNSINEVVFEKIESSVNSLPLCVLGAILEGVLGIQETSHYGREVSKYREFSDMLGKGRHLVVGVNKSGETCVSGLGLVRLSEMAHNTMTMGVMPEGASVKEIYESKYMLIDKDNNVIIGGDNVCDVMSDNHAREFLIHLLSEKQ